MISLDNLETLWTRIRPWALRQEKRLELVAHLELRMVDESVRKLTNGWPHRATFYWLSAERKFNLREALIWLALAASESDLAAKSLVTRLVARARRDEKRSRNLLLRAALITEMSMTIAGVERELAQNKTDAEIIASGLEEERERRLEKAHAETPNIAQAPIDDEDVPVELSIPQFKVPVLLGRLTLSGDRETVSKLREYRKLEDPIARVVVDPGWRRRLVEPRWFKPVIDLVDRRLMALRNRPFRLSPMLIVGPPGIGKSRFVADIGNVLGVPMLPLCFAGQSDARALLGTARGWSTANPTVIIDLILRHKRANPIVFVDEIEKSQASHNGDPIAAILTMLEPETARRFHDPLLQVEVDLSHVSWIAGANSLKGLPAPLLSRFHVVEVEGPDGRDWNLVRETLLHEIASSYQMPFDAFPTLNPLVDDMMRALLDRRRDLRVVRRVFEEVLGVSLEENELLRN